MKARSLKATRELSFPERFHYFDFYKLYLGLGELLSGRVFA
jgi:hypothetical protein